MTETQAIPGFKDTFLQRQGARDDDRLEWFRDARFGMFIHWGLYSLLAGRWRGQEVEGFGEWIMEHARIPDAEYSPLASRFDAADFDAKRWVSLARAAGQRYLTITTKHHDGFCLFDSEFTDYTIVKASPFGRDPLKELARECAAQGIKLCFYYSQTQDWHHPSGHGNVWDFDEPDDAAFDAYIQDYVKPQVRELLTNYGPIGLIWFDTPLRITWEQSRQLVELVHELQPECLVNGRIGNGLGDYGSAEDQTIPGELLEMDWESCMTMNDTWAYKADDENWKPSRVLIHQLVDSASRGGNYLLNIGPTGSGAIPEPSVERLLAVGAWLERNGESIYGTRPGPLQGDARLRSTVGRDGAVYLHVIQWPADGILTVSALSGVHRARLLHEGTELEFETGADSLTIRVPRAAPDQDLTVIALNREVRGR